MQGFINIVDLITDWTGKLISWLVLVMVLVTFSVVLLRYFFNTGWIAMQESVLYMHATVFMLGAAFTLKSNQHVRVDIFYQRMSKKTKAWIDLVGTLIFLLPVCILIIYSSWEYVANSWELQEGSREAGGLPGVYLLKTNIILMSLLLILQGLAEILRNSIFIAHCQSTDRVV